MTNESELLPCPFCGGAGDIESQPSYSQAANTYNRYRGWCDQCGFGLDWHSHESDAITAWNTRTPTSEAVPALRLQAAEAPGVQCPGCEGAGCDLCGQAGRVFSLATPSTPEASEQVDRHAVKAANAPLDDIVDAFFDVYGAVCRLEGEEPSDFTQAANIRFQDAMGAIRRRQAASEQVAQEAVSDAVHDKLWAADREVERLTDALNRIEGTSFTKSGAAYEMVKIARSVLPPHDVATLPHAEEGGA